MYSHFPTLTVTLTWEISLKSATFFILILMTVSHLWLTFYHFKWSICHQELIFVGIFYVFFYFNLLNSKNSKQIFATRFLDKADSGDTSSDSSDSSLLSRPTCLKYEFIRIQQFQNVHICYCQEYLPSADLHLLNKLNLQVGFSQFLLVDQSPIFIHVDTLRCWRSHQNRK